MAERKICVVTGTRAEYGLLYWLMKEIDADPTMQLQLIATGSHLESKFGETKNDIEKDGFRIDAEVFIDLSDDNGPGIGKSMGLALSGIAAALDRLRPDIVVLLGDRYEILAAAAAAMVCRCIIAHIHGGEITTGALDDSMRHAITKMAHLHFATAESYRRRIVQLGEDPDRVFTVGAPGLDNIDRLALPEKAAVLHRAGVKWPLDGAFFLITYHPETAQPGDSEVPVLALLNAIKRFPEYYFLITGVNADPGRDRVAKAFSTFVRENKENAAMVDSLGQTHYLAAMRDAAAVIGNSSSGIIEAPAFGVPTVNIGSRQNGRLRAASIIDCDADTAAIEASLRKALDPDFRRSVNDDDMPYGRPGASKHIKKVLKSYPLNGAITKIFYDVAWESLQ